MMFISRVFSLLLVAVVSFNSVQAQTSEEKGKEIERQQFALFEQIAKDAESLHLSENRALVAAKLAEGVWRYDEKRARALFQTAVNELVTAQIQAEANKK